MESHRTRPTAAARGLTVAALAAVLISCEVPAIDVADAAGSREAAARQQTSPDTRTPASSNGVPSAQAPPIPPGFEPVTLRDDADTPLQIRVWGREYVFTRGPTPTDIRTLGRRLLSEAPTYGLVVGGQEIAIAWDRPTVIETSERAVRLRTLGRAGATSVASETVVEYDGMVRVSLTLSAAQPIGVDRLRYVFRFDADIARFYNRHLEYDYRTMRVKRGELLETAGPISEAPMRLPYIPSLAIGNHEVGFEWWSDSDAGFHNDPKATPIALARNGDLVSFTVDPISSRLELQPDRPWTHEFAVFALPMRAPTGDAHAHRFLAPGEVRFSRNKAGLRFYSIFFPGQFEARWHGLPASVDSAKQRGVRERLAKAGVGYVPYAKLTAAPSMHPKTMANTEQWSAAGVLFRGPSPGERRFMLERGWVPGTTYGYAVCGTARAYFDWILDETLSTIRDESIAGVYYDWGSIMEPCASRVRDGELAWGLFELRDFYRRLYEGVKASHPDLPITIHTHGQPRAIGAFVDYVFIGEALNVVFRRGKSFPQIKANPKLYVPHYMDLPEGFLDAQVFPRSGGITALLPEVHFSRDENDPQREVALTREMFAETLVGGIQVWFANCHVATRTSIMNAIDRFGNLDDARFHPWRDDPLGVGNMPGVRAAAYSRKEGALLIVANRNDRPVEFVIKPNPTELGAGDASNFIDPERPGGKPQPIGERGIPISIPARDFRLVLLQ
jgi:hypothetical protein